MSKKTVHSKTLSVSPGILEEAMAFMKVTDEDVVMNTIGKHARSIIKRYEQGKHMKYWGVIDAYALMCITESKLLFKHEWDNAIADFEVFEKWMMSDSKLSHHQILVFQRFPSILTYILQQESRTKLRADLPKITDTFVWEQYSMLRRLIRDAHDVLKLVDMTEEKDERMGDMVKEIVRDLRSKTSAKVMKRLSKHMNDVLNFLEESISALDEAKKNVKEVPATPKAAAAKVAEEKKEESKEAKEEEKTKESSKESKESKEEKPVEVEDGEKKQKAKKKHKKKKHATKQ